MEKQYKLKRRNCRNQMISRSGKSKNYLNCKVCDEWKNGTKSFYEWYDDNYVENWFIDKDIKGDSTLYSPETCIFVPREVNQLFRTTNNECGYKGVDIVKSKRFRARIAIDNKTIYLGTFDTPEEATKVYLEARKVRLLELSVKYSDYPELSQLLKDKAQ